MKSSRQRSAAGVRGQTWPDWTRLCLPSDYVKSLVVLEQRGPYPCSWAQLVLFCCTSSWGARKSMRCRFLVVAFPGPEPAEPPHLSHRLVMAKHHTWLKQGTSSMQMETSTSHQGGGDWEKPRETGSERLAVVCTQCLEQPQRGHTLGTAGRREGLAFLCTSTLSWAAATSSQHAWGVGRPRGHRFTGKQHSRGVKFLPLSGNINSKANIKEGQNWNLSQRHSYWSASHGKNRNGTEQRLWDLQPWHCVTKLCSVTGVETEWTWGWHAALHMLNRSQGSCMACPGHCEVAPFSWWLETPMKKAHCSTDFSSGWSFIKLLTCLSNWGCEKHSIRASFCSKIS